MEIIKNGNIVDTNKSNKPTPKYKYITTCEKCKCEYSYTKEDSHKEYNAPNYSGLIGRIIDCPCCGTQIHFGTGKKVYFDGSKISKYNVGSTVYYWTSIGICKSKVVNIWKHDDGNSYDMKGYGLNNMLEKDLFPTLGELIKYLKDNIKDNTI